MLGDNVFHWLENGDAASRPTLTRAGDTLGGFIPGYAHPWLVALERHPVEFVAVSIVVLVSLYASTLLDTRIKDRAWLAWHERGREEYLKWRRESQRGTLVWVLIALGGTGAVFVASAFGEWAGASGLAVVTGILCVSLFEIAKIRRRVARSAQESLPPTFWLMLARKIRENRIIQGSYSWIFERVVPLGFAVIVVAAGFVFGNRILFDAASAIGLACANKETHDAHAKFTTKEVCWRTGCILNEGLRYRIRLTTDGNWPDGTDRADVELSASKWRHYAAALQKHAAALLKRWWTESWFKPIARINSLGNDEYVLNPVDPYARQVFGAEIEARSSGELFIYVNDAVLMVPGWSDLFYSNNTGEAEVDVTLLNKLDGSTQHVSCNDRTTFPPPWTVEKIPGG